MKFNFSIISIFIVTLIIYLFVAGRLGWEFNTEPANYFSHLAYAFLNGRLDLITHVWEHDLSIYDGKLYLYWGPTPVLLILPIIAIFGLNVSDILYTAIFAAFSTPLIYLILNQLGKLQLIKINNPRMYLLSLFFGFGTVYFSVATRGGIWFTSQVFSTLYVLVALYLFFLYLNSKKAFHLFFSSVFLGLGIWGRATFIFYLPLFLGLLIYFKERRLKLFISILAVIFALSALYNFLRFNDFLENGYSYQNFAPRFLLEKQNYGFLNLAYLPHNFYYNFLNLPTFFNQYPYVKFDPEGNSFLFLSPFFLLLFYLLKKKFWRTPLLKFLNISILLSTILIIFFQLIFWGTGWFQFSARYLLDIIPLLIILLAIIIRNISWFILFTLFTISVIFNTLGAMWLNGVLN